MSSRNLDRVFMRFPEFKRKAVTLSYDDGVPQDKRLIEIMNKNGLRGTFNINSELLSKRGVLTRNGQHIAHYKVHPEDIKTFYEGHEIAAHTLTHPNLTQCADEEIIRQVENDRLNLSDLVGYEVVGMAYPCGGVNNDDRVANIIKNNTGIQYARTITCNYSFKTQENLLRFNPTVFHLDFEKMMALGHEFVDLQTDTPSILYIWGHSYEMDFEPDYWIKLEEFFKLISGRKDVFYGTNKEILL